MLARASAATEVTLASEATPTAPAEPGPTTVQAVYVDAPPVIDGKLDDPCWSQAAKLEGFFAPDVEAKVPEETIGYLCLDSAALYVGFTCKDRTPDDLRAAETRRNGSLWDDDVVEFALDPGHDHQELYFFRVNARGTQAEDIPGGSATKIEWRGDWRAAACRTPDGWSAEIAIPFSILRYPPGQTTWGFFISRHFAQERLWVVHPITGKKAFDITLSSDLVGVRPPPYKPRPILMPYATLDFGEAVGERYNVGLDMQYRMVSGLTALTTLRPDFKQIEDVVEPIAFSYTERYLPDLRPFFVTGGGFLPGSLMLYTRRIQDFDAGAKLFGKLGKESIGLLDAVTLGEQNVLAAQWQHQFTDDLSTTMRFVSDARDGEADNSVVGFDGFRRWRCKEGEDGLGMMYRHSQTDGLDHGSVYELSGFHFRGSGRLGWDWGLRLTTPEFNPRLGYYYDQNSVGGRLAFGKWTRYETGPIEFRSWDVFNEYFPRLEGEGVLRTGISPGYTVGWRNGRFISVGFTRGQEYDQDNSEGRFRFGWNERDIHRRGMAFVLKGVRAGGDYTYYTFDQGFRPLKDLSVVLNLQYSHLEPPSSEAGHEYQAVVTASYDLTPEKCISARLIKRDAGTALFVAYRQVVRRGMDAYVLVGDPDPAKSGFTKRLAVKLIWAL